MGIVFNGLILGSLAVALVEFERPKLCATIYGVFVVGMQLLNYSTGAVNLLQAIVFSAILVGASYGLFELLNRIEPYAWSWWLLLALGIVWPLFF